MEIAPAKTPLPAAAPAGLPVFYARPELLDPAKHGGRSLARTVNFGFTKRTNSVPLNGVEFILAQRNYPIVFSNEAAPFPVALLGLQNEENLFVGAAGDWTPGAYVPAYIRRYPFIFMEGGDGKQFALCIDAASPLIVENVENPFFKDGQPTDLTKSALNFCGAFQQEYEQTKPFCAALMEHKLLETKAADMKLPGGKSMAFGPFRVVDEAKFRTLPADLLADWQKKGWLGWIYAHLFSFSNWPNLVSRTKAPAAGEGEIR